MKSVLPFFLYPILFVLIFSLSSETPPALVLNGCFFLEARYFFHLQIILILGSAIALSKISMRQVFVGIFLVFGLIGLSSLAFREPFGRVFRYKGYSYSYLGRLWGYSLLRMPEKFQKLNQVAVRFPEKDRRFFYWGAMDIMTLRSGLLDPMPLAKRMDEIPPADRLFFAEALGALYSCEKAGDGESVSALLKTLPENLQPHFYAGLFRHAPCLSKYSEELKNFAPGFQSQFFRNLGSYYSVNDDPLWRQLKPVMDRADADGKLWAHRGMGMAEADCRLCFNEPFGVCPSQTEPAYQADIFWGLGWELGQEFPEDPLRVRDWVLKLPETFRPQVLSGVEAWERWYQLAPSRTS